MSSVESRDTRAFFQPDGQLADVSDYFEVESLPEFVTRARSGWVLDLLRQKLLYPVFHPLIRPSGAPGNGSSTNGTTTNGGANGEPKVYGYECLTRATVDSRVTPPEVMFDLARAAGFCFRWTSQRAERCSRGPPLIA